MRLPTPSLTRKRATPTLARTLVLARAIHSACAVKRESGSHPAWGMANLNCTRNGTTSAAFARTLQAASMLQAVHATVRAGRKAARAGRRSGVSSVRIPARYVGFALRGCGAGSVIFMRQPGVARGASLVVRPRQVESLRYSALGRIKAH
ncbi:hypothetical protein PUN4_820015 [Paraburkholderia unamae]|nr:hypothetical protein PUN4_820015 [Paraburkholderia unamae]